MQKYSCKVCGADLKWNPDAGALLCDYCGASYAATDFKDDTITADENKDTTLQAEYTQAGADLAEGMVVYACKNCGAEVVTSNTTMATTCAYCGNAISITNKSAGKFRPEVVVPYAVNKDKAKDIYKQYVNKSFLTPKEFKQANEIEKMQGLFVPFWLHSMDSRAQAQFECENISHTRRGNDRVTTHKVYDVYVDASGIYENIPTDGSKKLEDSLMDALEPFNYTKLTPYNPAFMAGFFSEQPDEEKEATIPRAQQRAIKSMTEQMTASAGNFSTKKVVRFNNRFSNEKASYAMLPVWLLNVKHQGKDYLFAVNGDTGKVVGKLPMSVSKLVLTVLATGLASQVAMMLLRLFGIM